MVMSKVKGQKSERGRDQAWNRRKVGARNEEQVCSKAGLRNRVRYRLQEAGKSRVKRGRSSRKFAQLLGLSSQLTS